MKTLKDDKLQLMNQHIFKKYGKTKILQNNEKRK